ncbi:NAD(P)/FAD-dependent oxidoreductase [Pseudophaeobacter sp.]|uniref:NAD(P)/FAD-dependent oxidoreductase n=1 Tax=Pseudophaeobacter sp. TaxID=1971739 RepID=UPI003296C1DB
MAKMITNSVIDSLSIGYALLGTQPKTPLLSPQKYTKNLFDVIIIGAGVVGCAMARRFTLEGAKVAIVEKASDILDGASKANSAILHTGFDAPPGSLELQCVQAGYREYESIRDELGLVQEKSGALVVAWSPKDLAGLEAIQNQAHDNGVQEVTFLDRAALRKQEPNLSQAALGALFVQGESIIDPWSAPYAYLHQALENGARSYLSCAITNGEFDGEVWSFETSAGVLRSRAVINCAGLYGDLVDQALLGQSQFHITPRKGQFVVFDKAASALVSSVILPVPNATTKGVVLFRTVFGNLVVGPTAEDQESREDSSCDADTLQALLAEALQKLPALAEMPVTATYAGLRPASEQKVYRIETRADMNWITVGGIRSTGLSASLGIAAHVFDLYSTFGRTHAPLQRPETPQANVLADCGPRGWKEAGNSEIVCHCELVTRREIEAALKGPLRARSLAGLKRQTRATMGRCQGFYCSARLSELTTGMIDPPIAKEILRD